MNVEVADTQATHHLDGAEALVPMVTDEWRLLVGGEVAQQKAGASTNMMTRSLGTDDDHNGGDNKKSGGAAWLYGGATIRGPSGDEKMRTM